MFMFHMLTLNALRMEGNPHLNFAWQNAIELPAVYIGQYVGNKIGRRYTQVLSFSLGFLINIPIFFIVQESKYAFVVQCLAISVRFVLGIIFFAIHLQAMEIFPTPLRQTGMALLQIIGNSFGLLVPWVIYLVSFVLFFNYEKLNIYFFNIRELKSM